MNLYTIILKPAGLFPSTLETMQNLSGLCARNLRVSASLARRFRAEITTQGAQTIAPSALSGPHPTPTTPHTPPQPTHPPYPMIRTNRPNHKAFGVATYMKKSRT